MAIEHRLYTVKEFEQIADSPENVERRLELVNGEIVEKPMPTEEHGVITGNIYGPLWNFVNPRKLGRVVIEVRYRKPDDQHNARIPDIAFSSAKRPLVKQGSVPEMPDLAVEVLSPDQSLKELREKARYFLANGTKLVWLVIPEKRLIEVYTPDKEEVLTEIDTLEGDNVLPGFSMAVRDVFADPME
jgi:Uma2 family endonuclease